VITPDQLQTVVDAHLAKLVAVGDADALALEFQGQGMKATCGSPGFCALAVSFEEAVEETLGCPDANVSVGISSLVVCIAGASARAKLPAWMSKFIQRFDKGEFSAIVDWSGTKAYRQLMAAATGNKDYLKQP
jgi:hypothetical protein